MVIQAWTHLRNQTGENLPVRFWTRTSDAWGPEGWHPTSEPLQCHAFPCWIQYSCWGIRGGAVTSQLCFYLFLFFYPSAVLKVSAGGFRAPCPVVMCCLFSFAFITRRMRGNDNRALGEMLGLVLLCTMTKQIVQVGDRLVQCRLLQMALSGLEMANTRHLSC